MKNIDYHTLAESVALILKQKDAQELSHSINVSRMCVQIAKLMNRFTSHEIEMLNWGSQLHDVGKVFLDDTTLNFPRKLTSKEAAIMQTHTVLGRDFVTALECDPIVIEIVHRHHFNEDGSGYPHSGADPSIFPRIVRVADAFDAMTNHRVYRFPMSDDEAMMLLEAEAGRIFNAEVVNFMRFALAEVRKEDRNVLAGKNQAALKKD